MLTQLARRGPNVDEDEVLFLTSRERLYDAYVRWYRHSGDTSEYAKQQALETSRTLMRYLRIPTIEEVEAYREEPITV